jgi:hypothetical protein
MSVIEVVCPNPACGARLKAPADRAGKKAKCTKCQSPFRDAPKPCRWPKRLPKTFLSPPPSPRRRKLKRRSRSRQPERHPRRYRSPKR